MRYKYFDISDMSLADWTKVFEFCLKKADFFDICHIHNYDKMARKDRELFDSNGAKTELLWHFDYNFEYISVDTDGMKNIRSLYQNVLDASDFVYLCLPADMECAAFLSYAQKNSSFTITKSLKGEGEEYYEIFGVMNEGCKKALTEAELLNYMQTARSEWLYKIYKSGCGSARFCAAKNYIGFLLNDAELKLYEDKSGELRNKRLSNIFVSGKVREDLLDILVNLFSVSIMKPYDSGIPFFANIGLMKEKRQILYFNDDELLVCLSDSEICEMAEEYQIDVTKYKMRKEQSDYCMFTDY